MNIQLSIEKKENVNKNYFKHIIYIDNTNKTMMVDDFQHITYGDLDDLSTYLPEIYPHHETSIFPNGNLYSIKKRRLFQKICLYDKPQFIWLPFIFDLKLENYQIIKIKKFSNPKNIDLSGFENGNVIFLKVPLLKTNVILYNFVNSNNDITFFSVQKLYLEYKNRYYRFPYSNVSSSCEICFGDGHNKFTDIDHIKNKFQTYPFNGDYGFAMNNIRNDATEDIIKIHEDINKIPQAINKISQAMNENRPVRLEEIFIYLTYQTKIDDVIKIFKILDHDKFNTYISSLI
jgi:hypothetical protein